MYALGPALIFLFRYEKPTRTTRFYVLSRGALMEYTEEFRFRISDVTRPGFRETYEMLGESMMRFIPLLPETRYLSDTFVIQPTALALSTRNPSKWNKIEQDVADVLSLAFDGRRVEFTR